MGADVTTARSVMGPRMFSLARPVNHYSDVSSDSPAWTSDSSSAGVVTTRRYVPGFVGLLAEAATTGGVTSTVVELTGLHGDVLRATTPTATLAPDGVGVWTDEFGRVLDATGSLTTGPRYGWLGGKQRATDTGTTGLTLMGVRLYSPIIGRFLSTDPVYGGNANTYTYPVDPVNSYDLDGRSVWDVVSVVATCLAIAALVVGTGGAALYLGAAAAALSALSAYHDYSERDVLGAAIDVAGVVGFGAEFRALRGVARAADEIHGVAQTNRAFKGAKAMRKRLLKPFLRSRGSWARRAHTWHGRNEVLAGVTAVYGGFHLYQWGRRGFVW